MGDDYYVQLPDADKYFLDHSERSRTAAKLREVANIIDPLHPRRITLVIEDRGGQLFIDSMTVEPGDDDG